MKVGHLCKSAVLACSFSFIAVAQTDTTAPAGTEITVRTNDSIDAKNANDGRIYSAVVDAMSWTAQVRLPFRGIFGRMIVRNTSDR